MKLNISIDKEYYSADSIENGRIISSFFSELSENVFKQSYKYHKKFKEISGHSELPLLYTERNLYSIFAASIDKIHADTLIGVDFQ